jgi:hypothetical protein
MIWLVVGERGSATVNVKDEGPGGARGLRHDPVSGRYGAAMYVQKSSKSRVRKSF